MSDLAGTRARSQPERVLAVRAGPGGTCSAAGSALDLLFGATLVATAALAAVLASSGRAAPAAPAKPEDPPAPPRADDETTSAGPG